MNIKDSILDLIGNTPLVKLNKIIKENNVYANIYAKVEYFNLTGSIKDRIAKAMIEDAEKENLLKEGGIIIEPTSGNTGIGLAAVGLAKGYEVIIVMPDSFSKERRQLIKAYGAKVVLSDGKLGMAGAIAKANNLKEELENAYIPQQFDNHSNWKAHYETTGPEIYKDMEGNIDILIAGVGTGGTITGIGKYLKEKNPNIKIIGLEPKNSPILTQGKSGSHKIQGIGAGFIPTILDRTIIDEIITIDDQEAIDYAIELSKKEALFVGISSGAAICGAIKVGQRIENKGKNIVTILPDNASRYLSTGIYGEE